MTEPTKKFDRILVTGATGFIGSHLTRALRSKYPNSKIVGVSRSARTYPYELNLNQYRDGSYHEPFEMANCDLTQEGLVASLMLRYRPDAVFHLGAVSTIKPNDSDPCLVTRANVLSTHHLLAYAKPRSRFVLASSAAVYGDGGGYPFVEDDEARPTSAYGASKVAAEALVRAYRRSGAVSGLILRYAATVGAGATHGLLKDLVAKLKSGSDHLDLLGNFPGSVKPFTHVSDVADGTVHFAESAVGSPLNLANFDSVSVADVAETVMRTLGVQKPVRFLGEAANWKGDNRLVQIDSSAAVDFGWKRNYPSSLAAVERAVKDMEGIQ